MGIHPVTKVLNLKRKWHYNSLQLIMFSCRISATQSKEKIIITFEFLEISTANDAVNSIS